MIVSLNGLSMDIDLDDTLRELCVADDVAGIRSFLRSEVMEHVVTYLMENGCQVREVKDTMGVQSWKDSEAPWGRH